MKSLNDPKLIARFVLAEQDLKAAISLGNQLARGNIVQTPHTIGEAYYIIWKHQAKKQGKSSKLNEIAECFDEFFMEEDLTSVMETYVFFRHLLDKSEGKSFVAEILALDDEMPLDDWMKSRIDAENKEKSSSEKTASEADSSENVKKAPEKKAPSKKTSSKKAK